MSIFTGTRRGRESRREGFVGHNLIRILFGWVTVFLLPVFPFLLEAKTLPVKNLEQPRLVEPGELSQISGNPSVRIIDLRTSLPDYLKGHLPNALYLSFEVIQVPRNGVPAQIPDRITFEKILGEYLSISNDMWVVLYSEKSNPNASYLAWALDYLGHKRVGLLNGGWEKWNLDKLPVTQEYPSLTPKKFFGKVLRETMVDKKYLRGRLEAKGVVVVDARPPRQYSGEDGEEIRKGHIPGARNVFWETTLEGEEAKTWKKKEELERLFSESGVTRDKEIIVHCRTGREASHVYFTLRYVLGYPKVRLYRGSWVEWSADKTLPVKTGTEP
jgi:thiosulfate/3-mercaptopyruvate sulfurtransferase